MKKTFTTLVFLALVLSVKSQVVFDSFDTSVESNFEVATGGLTDTSRVFPFVEEAIVSEGEGALLCTYNIEAAFDWGGVSQLRLRNPESVGLWDFSDYESISLDFYNKVPSDYPGRAKLNIVFFDASEVEELTAWGLVDMEWWYSYQQVLDLDEGWNTIQISLENVGAQSSTGFYQPLAGSGVVGNSSFDLDQIRAIGIEVGVSGPQDFEQIKGEFILDNFLLYPHGSTSIASSLTEETFQLGQNFPNPFYDETTISFILEHQQNVELSVFDLSGKEVSVLVNESLSPGEYHIPFSAEKLAGGTYFYRLRAGDYTSTRKMIVLR